MTDLRLLQLNRCQTSAQERECQKHVGIGGVLQSTYNISLTLNTDGISMFKSSAKCSLWPLYLVINELPPQMRFCPKFMILAAVWCQHEKPDVYVYVYSSPLMRTLQTLFEQSWNYLNFQHRKINELRSLLELLLESAILFCFLLPLTYLPELSLPV